MLHRMEWRNRRTHNVALFLAPYLGTIHTNHPAMLRPALFIAALALTPVSFAQTAASVITDMIAYAQMPAPINPTCSYHVVHMGVTITDNELNYSAATKLFGGSDISSATGTKVKYNTLVTSKLPLQMREFTAGSVVPADRSGSVTLGWEGTKPLLLGSITISLPNAKTKTYALSPDLKVTTLASGNKYILSGTLLNGAIVTIYLEKNAFSDCRK